MKKRVIRFAQKGIVVKRKGNKTYLLLVKYHEAPYKDTYTVEGKYGCPGGRLEFGEDLDKSLRRECKEETGITIIPKEPVGLISWQVEKPDEITHMVAVFRICKYRGGKLKNSVEENETKLGKAQWIDINTFDLDKNLIKSEIPVVRKAISSIEKGKEE